MFQHIAPHPMIFNMQHGALRQCARHLMHALYTDVRTALQCAPFFILRSFPVEIQMPSMRLVNQ